MESVLGLIFLLVATSALAESPYNGGFASGNPADYVEGSLDSKQIRIAPLDGVHALLVIDGKVRLKAVAVTPSTKYTLSLDTSFTGEVESIEENPRFEFFAQPFQRSPVLPSREIQFLDAAGNTVGRTLVFSMPFREKHRYTDVFYTPSDAATLRLNIASGEGVTLALRNLRIEETADEGAINVNPALKLGPLNYSGWQNISAGGKIIETDHKTVFDTKYGSRGTEFPLPGPGTYALSAKATGNGYNSCVQVDLFDAKGVVLLKVSTRRYGPPSYFVAPREAVSASLLVYSCLLEEVRLVRVGDESAIDTLAK